MTPIGTIVMFGGDSAPDGWLFCDGSAVSRTTYSDLFAVIGETYGNGDGTTTFNLPDFRGRSPLGGGQGDGLTARAIGDSGGEETHQLTVSEMPEHNHGYNMFNQVVVASSGGSGQYAGYLSGGVTGSTGGDSAHNTMHPFLGVNFIIRYEEDVSNGGSNGSYDDLVQAVKDLQYNHIVFDLGTMRMILDGRTVTFQEG